MKWCDTLRVKSEFPINLWPNAVQAYHRWIRTAIRDNVPYDRFARELLTASGSNFRDAAGELLPGGAEPRARGDRVGGGADLHGRARGGLAEGAARRDGRVLLADRLQVHRRVEGRNRLLRSRTSAPGRPGFGGQVVPPRRPTARVRLEPGQDPREAFASWLTSPSNPWFARAAVNRAWFWLLGRGIVHEPDDIRPDNPPSHPELLTLSRARAGRGAVRHEARLPPDSQFDARTSCRRSRRRRPPRRRAASRTR